MGTVPDENENESEDCASALPSRRASISKGYGLLRARRGWRLSTRHQDILWWTAAIYVGFLILTSCAAYLVANEARHSGFGLMLTRALPLVLCIASTSWLFRGEYRRLREQDAHTADRVRSQATLVAEVCTAASLLAAFLAVVPIVLDTERNALKSEIDAKSEPLRHTLGIVFLQSCFAADVALREAALCEATPKVSASDFTQADPQKAIAELIRGSTKGHYDSLLHQAFTQAGQLWIGTAKVRLSYLRLNSEQIDPSTKFHVLLASLYLVAFGITLKIGRAWGDLP